MKSYLFDEVFKLDQNLYQLASYEVTGGRLLMPKTQEEAAEIQKKIATKFNEFKQLIQNSECTYDFIRNNVLSKNGAFPKINNIDIDSPDFVTNISNSLKEDNELALKEKDAPKELKDFISDVLKGFSDLTPLPDNKPEQKALPPPSENTTENTTFKKKQRSRKKS